MGERQRNEPDPRDDLRIISPCPKRWSELEGEGRRRHCSECELHVHNLSLMDADEVAALRASRAEGSRLCVAYLAGEGGAPLTKPEVLRRLGREAGPNPASGGRAWPRSTVAALLAAGLLAGCDGDDDPRGKPDRSAEGEPSEESAPEEPRSEDLEQLFTLGYTVGGTD